jgi:hypothetical protein
VSAAEPPDTPEGTPAGERSRRRSEANHRGDEVEPRRGLTTESLILGFLGIALVLAAIVYAIFDPYGGEGGVSGTVLFVAGACFAFLGAGYFQLELRRVQADVEAGERAHAEAGEGAPDAGGLYLPETSVWPLCIGLGTAFTLLGLPLRWWFLLPGVALLGYGFVGFAHQSRTRS